MFDVLANPPAWATSDEALAWYYGFAFAIGVRLTRAGLKWLRRAGTDTSHHGDAD